jgi:peptide/nickel transport system permease protein
MSAQYIFRRLAYFVLVLGAMTVVMFVISHLIPGDPAAAMAGFGAPKYVIESIRHQLGLDRPLHEQYLVYMRDLVHGNLGVSIARRTPINQDLKRYFPASAELVLAAMAISVPVGILLGIVAAACWRRWPDVALRTVSLLGASLPMFWVALVFQLVFFRSLRLFPAGGRIGDNVVAPRTVTGFLIVDSILAGNLPALRSALHHIAMPALTLALNSVGLLLRQTRASMLMVLGNDYVRTARAKGLRERTVIWRHAFRNAAIPVATEVGLQFGILLGATFLVETVYYWPGLGLYAVRAIPDLDFPAIMGVTLVYTIVYLVMNFVVDLVYPLLNPTIRF